MCFGVRYTQFDMQHADRQFAIRAFNFALDYHASNFDGSFVDVTRGDEDDLSSDGVDLNEVEHYVSRLSAEPAVLGALVVVEYRDYDNDESVRVIGFNGMTQRQTAEIVWPKPTFEYGALVSGGADEPDGERMSRDAGWLGAQLLNLTPQMVRGAFGRREEGANGE